MMRKLVRKNEPGQGRLLFREGLLPENSSGKQLRDVVVQRQQHGYPIGLPDSRGLDVDVWMDHHEVGAGVSDEEHDGPDASEVVKTLPGGIFRPDEKFPCTSVHGRLVSLSGCHYRGAKPDEGIRGAEIHGILTWSAL